MEPSNDTSGTLLKDALANFSNLEEQRPQVLVCISKRGERSTTIKSVKLLPILTGSTENKFMILLMPPLTIILRISTIPNMHCLRKVLIFSVEFVSSKFSYSLLLANNTSLKIISNIYRREKEK